MGLYSDNDEDYANTSLAFTVPPPSLRTIPPPPMNQRSQRPGGGQPVPQKRAWQEERPRVRIPVEVVAGDRRNLDTLTNSQPLPWESKDTVPPWTQVTVLDKPDAFDVEPFINTDLLQFVQTLRTRVHGLDHATVAQARELVTPALRLGRSVFCDRRAVEFAALDYLFALLSPRNPQENTFYFIECNGGPGGISDFILWRKQVSRQQIHGWGVGLGRGECSEFTPQRFYSRSTAKDHYSVSSASQCDQGWYDMVDRCGQDIDRTTVGQGVHLAVVHLAPARGETPSLTYAIFLAQIQWALMTLRQEGHLILRLTRPDNALTISLFYILNQLFGDLNINVPPPCDPTHEVRYLVARHMRCPRPFGIEELLTRAIHTLLENSALDPNQLTLVNHDKLVQDLEFTRYLDRTNTKCTSQQLKALQSVSKYVIDGEPIAVPYDPHEVCTTCAQSWQLPVPRDEYRPSSRYAHNSGSSRGRHGAPSATTNVEDHRKHPRQRYGQSESSGNRSFLDQILNDMPRK
ncbi:hypothetical protein IWQ62_000949 [Dispira parvispora]|uniref:Cap-specific mRNA (nucleoside-2'-O-)-methyltransferase 1 n=1 Tax=Dispira parvispora TaxID=1520584 RepID=A0A9W8B064_9FUNG|nr:hypothetical protein IWQ62_000949 [Dispira parvispora]